MRLVALLLVMLVNACVKIAPPEVKVTPPKPVEPIADVIDPKIPREAYKWKSVVVREVRYWWGLDESTNTVFAQIHQESRWRYDARSKYASGLAQFTPDTVSWISSMYPADLGEANPLDPRWAIRAMVVYDRDLMRAFSVSPSRDRWAFTLASYNGGKGWVIKEQALAANAGRDRNLWYCNTEHQRARAEWAWKENRDYPVKIERWRTTLYKEWNY